MCICTISTRRIFYRERYREVICNIHVRYVDTICVTYRTHNANISNMYVCLHMHACRHGWMDGWMDGWMGGWLAGWLAVWMDGYVIRI